MAIMTFKRWDNAPSKTQNIIFETGEIEGDESILVDKRFLSLVISHHGARTYGYSIGYSMRVYYRTYHMGDNPQGQDEDIWNFLGSFGTETGYRQISRLTFPGKKVRGRSIRFKITSFSSDTPFVLNDMTLVYRPLRSITVNDKKDQ